MDPELADAIRRALIDAAEAAYEDAGMQGLCAEGRWEAAVSAMRRVDIAAVARKAAEAAAASLSTGVDDNRSAGDRNGAVGVSGGPVHPDRP
jgi:hypothetical protein